MRKFEVTVEREDKYIIEIDDTVHNEEWMEEFRSFMYDLRTLEEHADHIAQFRARFGERFIEGYGNVLINGENPFGKKDEDTCKTINIKVVSEDGDIWSNVKEIE